MGTQQRMFRGAFLGLAVGDAMGYTVDRLRLSEIRETYGPNGLLGYDLVNGYAEVTSYTQIAAFTANGLLTALTHQKLGKGQIPPLRYIAAALREWSRSQHYCQQERNFCWLSTVPELKRRRCMDTRLLDALSRSTLGTPEAPAYRSDLPSGLSSVLSIAMLRGQLGLSEEALADLSGRTVALTHGEADAILSGAALALAFSFLMQEPNIPPRQLIHRVQDQIQLQFGKTYSRTTHLWELLQLAVTLADSDTTQPAAAMELLRCQTAPEVLAGVAYACLICGGDFDTAMIAAVNHSGRSAAVGAITGALLGICLGEEALPEFYIESLEPAGLLRELADDMDQGCPMGANAFLFDDDWDRKYLHGGF